METIIRGKGKGSGYATKETLSKLSEEQSNKLIELKKEDPNLRVSESFIAYMLNPKLCPYCGKEKPFTARYMKSCGQPKCAKLAASRKDAGEKISKKLKGTHLSEEAKKNVSIAGKRRYAKLKEEQNKQDKLNEIEYYKNPKICKSCGKVIPFNVKHYRRYVLGTVKDTHYKTFCNYQCSVDYARGHVHTPTALDNMKHTHKHYTKRVKVEPKKPSLLMRLLSYIKSIFAKFFEKKEKKIKPSKAHLDTLKKRYKTNDEVLEKYFYAMIDKINRPYSPKTMQKFTFLYERKRTLEEEIKEVKEALRKK